MLNKPRTSLNFKKMMAMASLSLLCSSVVIAKQDTTENLTVHFAPGEVIQLIAPVSDPEKRELRAAYFKKNASVAQQYGYQSDGVLTVEETLVGDFTPNVLVISHWPSLLAQRAFQSLPQWGDVKQLRRQAWEELKLYDHQLEAPLTLTFHRDKTYTVAFAWTNPDHPGDYFDYMERLPPLLEKTGGRFVHTINEVTLSAHNPHALPPQQITLVEWDSPDGVQKLQALPEFAELSPKLRSGTVRFELHRVRPQS